MQQLIIFLGDQGSEKDQLFKLLPIEFKEIVFEKLLIKERIDQGDKKLIFMNFPEENEITSAIHSLLALSQYFMIIQIVFCLEYAQSVTQKVSQLIKLFNEAFDQEVENIYTFFINNSPQNLQNNRIYQFSKIDESNKPNFISILQNIQNSNSCILQDNLQNTIKQQQEQLQKRVSIMVKQFEEEYLSTNQVLLLENNLQKILSNEIQLLSKQNQDKNIKQNEIILYSDTIYQICCNKQEQRTQISKLNGWFYKLSYCNNCQILYQQQDQKCITYELYLFSLDLKQIDNLTQNKCYKCQQQYLTKMKQKTILFLLQIYLFKQIKNNLKIQVGTSKQLIQEGFLNIKNKIDCVSILLLSDEDELKQFVMQRAYENNNYKETKQFKKGDILNDSFQLIDTPIFQFDEDSENLESIYSNYLNENPINFIIFCLKLQRSSLIKQRLFSMLKKLPKINKQAFGALIINQNSDVQVEQTSEQEIINNIKGLIPQTTLIQNTNTNVEIIKKISDFINNINQTQQISFEQTIFHKQGNESNQEQIEKSLQLMSQNISDQYIQNCQQEIKDEEIRQEKLEYEKQTLQQQISNLNSEFCNKKKEFTNLIYSIQQELREQEKNYLENIHNLNNKIHQVEINYTSSILNLRSKKSQLIQMEIEKSKKIQNLNYSRVKKYN